MTKVSITSLLDAGSHFGHQTRRWNPKMKPYIFGSRGDIYIIDLKQTLVGLDQAYTFVSVLPKKEQILLHKELSKLQTNLNGIRNMKRTPDAVFVIDTNREAIAIHESRRLDIPVVGTLDTNCDPDDVDFGIPANDDAIRSVRLLADFIADAVIAGVGVPVTAAAMAAPAEAAEAVAEAAVETAAAEVAVEAVAEAAVEAAAPATE